MISTVSNTPLLSNTYSPQSCDLQSSLIESFQIIGSLEQMELCQKLEILNKTEQQQAHKISQSLINHQLPVHLNEWNTLYEWVLMLRDRYQQQLELQSIRVLKDDSQRIQHFDQIASLSARLELYGQAHDDLSELLTALKGLRNEWKHRKRDVENIVLSILSASNQYRVIKVTRAHLVTLNLGLSSLGKYYVIFDGQSEEDQKTMLNQVAQDFAQVFEENAAQNLARMAASYHRVFDPPKDDLLRDIQQLVHQIQPPTLLYPTSLPNNADTFRERRKSVVLVTDKDLVLFNIASPLFEPWDWPHILKHKKSQGIWSTSVSRLADHFSQVGLDYYSNMLNNARLMHAHKSQMFEFATHSLIKVYRALQLEQGLANLDQTLDLISKLLQQ